MFNELPLHSVAVFALEICGVGLTEIVTVLGVPKQLPNVDVGVTE